MAKAATQEGYYEIIYETGSFSVAYYESGDDMLEAVSMQHYRAVNGMAGGPVGHPAERVKRVLFYGDKDPGTESATREITREEALAVVEDLNADGVLDRFDLAAAFTPKPLLESDPHESNYAHTEVSEVSADAWQKPVTNSVEATKQVQA